MMHNNPTGPEADARRVGDEQLFSATVPSPIGVLTVIVNTRAIVAIEWDTTARDRAGTSPDARLATAISVTDGTPPGARGVLEGALVQLEEYFTGERTEFDLPLEPTGTPFQLRAWEALRRIPFGATISYGEQAAMLGDRNKSRAVGAANGKNPIPIVVPCHRVVGSNGRLTGFAGGLEAKAWLLDHEFRVRAGG